MEPCVWWRRTFNAVVISRLLYAAFPYMAVGEGMDPLCDIAGWDLCIRHRQSIPCVRQSSGQHQSYITCSWQHLPATWVSATSIPFVLLMAGALYTVLMFTWTPEDPHSISLFCCQKLWPFKQWLVPCFLDHYPYCYLCSCLTQQVSRLVDRWKWNIE